MIRGSPNSDHNHDQDSDTHVIAIVLVVGTDQEHICDCERGS